MLKTKLVLILFTLLLSYNIHGFIMIPIVKKHKVIKLNHKQTKLNLLNYTNNFDKSKNEDITEKFALLFKTFTDVMMIYILVYNVFYIIYIIKYM